MAGNFFTGATNGRPVVTSVAVGSTRFNTTNNHYEVYDGTTWVSMGTGKVETMYDCVQALEDQLAIRIEDQYKDNVAIQDAFRAWEEASERFKIVLAIAEKK